MDTLRISDADREAAMGLLSEQYAEGRLTKDEFDERSDAVWSARTRGDLAPVFVDLPVPSPAVPAVPARMGGRRSRSWPVPLAPIVFLLVAVTIITHLPFVLFALVLWFCFSRWRGGRRGGWHGGRRSWSRP
jgi:hypothetical protein